MKRIITAVIAIPLVLLTTIYAPDWLFGLIVALFAALALEEFLNLGVKRGMTRPARWFSVVGGAVTVAFLGGPPWVLTATILSALVLLGVSVIDGPVETALFRVVHGLAGMLYCCLTLGFLIFLPREAIVVLLGLLWSGDSAAYYVGSLLGRHPLAPKVSPKKTVEGAVAGLIASIAGGTMLGIWLLGESGVVMFVVSATSAAAGQIGDLAESVLKRSAGVKDSSSILPGHGGILDRLDSMIFSAPVFYWLISA